MLEIYKYEEYYYIDFTSEPTGNGEVIDYRVKLFKRVPFSATPPTPIELDGAPSPFILSLSNEDDPLLAFRSTTARISFIDDIDLADLELKSPRDWQVKLYRLSDGKQVFAGYLTTEVYTQPAIEGPNTLTLNAASPMVVASATPMAIQGKGLLTMGELLKLAIDSSRLIDTVYIPAIYATEQNATAANYAEVLRWAFSPSQYIKVSDTALIDGAEYEYSPYSDALSAICKLFGWSMVDVGDGALYFISPGYQGKYMRFTAEQLTATESFTPELVTPTISDEALLQPIDTADVVEVRQGVGSVYVEQAANKSDVIMESFASKSRDWVLEQSNSIITTDIGGRYLSVVSKITPRIKSAMQFPRYRASIVEDAPGTFTATASWEEVKDGSEQSGDVYAEYRRIDSCTSADLQPGGQKKSWSYNEVAYLNDFTPYKLSYADRWLYLSPVNLPIVRITGRIGVVTSGAIVVDFDLRCVPQDGFYMPQGGVVDGAADRLVLGAGDGFTLANGYRVLSPAVPWPPDKEVRCSLRIGDKYWTGSEWVNFHSIFGVAIDIVNGEWQKILTNKVITMPYGGDSGYFAEVKGALAGDVELCVYPIVSSPSGRYPLRYEMRGLKVSYAPPLNYIEEENEGIFYKDLMTDFSERAEITLPLHSRVDVSEHSSLLYNILQQPIDTLYRTTSLEADKPERFLLDEYQRLFGRALQRWRRGIELRNLQPLDLFSRAGYSENALALTGYTMDFEANTAEAYLSDVELPIIRRYVE